MFQPNQQVGHYTLIRLLGRGAFGEVWLAEKRNSLLDRQVALKIPLNPDGDLAAIQKEAQTWLHAGHHPNVLPVIDAEVANGQVMIASEFAADGSLAGWLKQHGGKAPSAEAAVAMATGILSGLEHLHNLKPQPIIHRDLKPDNVLLHNGVPRLTDFGISRLMKTTAFTQRASGTPSYMPPEAFDGKYSTQSDIWAMGVMLYQMLSGRLPYPQNDIVSLFGAIKQHGYDALPPDIPERLRQIVDKALSKEPAQRFVSAAAMRDALKAEQQVPPLETVVDVKVQKAQPIGSRGPLLEQQIQQQQTQQRQTQQELNRREQKQREQRPGTPFLKAVPVWIWIIVPVVLGAVILKSRQDQQKPTSAPSPSSTTTTSPPTHKLAGGGAPAATNLSASKPRGAGPSSSGSHRPTPVVAAAGRLKSSHSEPRQPRPIVSEVRRSKPSVSESHRSTPSAAVKHQPRSSAPNPHEAEIRASIDELNSDISAKLLAGDQEGAGRDRQKLISLKKQLNSTSR